jgi:hypothetical protein
MTHKCPQKFATSCHMAGRAATFGLTVLLVAGCAERSATVKHGKPQDIPDAPWSVSYHDGSNNGFICQQAKAGGEISAEYSPVTPERSSSGTYSGGAPWKGTVTPAQAKELWRKIRGLQADKAGQQTNRTMGSGALGFKTPAGGVALIVSRGKDLAQLDSFLEQLRK